MIVVSGVSLVYSQTGKKGHLILSFRCCRQNVVCNFNDEFELQYKIFEEIQARWYDTTCGGAVTAPATGIGG